MEGASSLFHGTGFSFSSCYSFEFHKPYFFVRSNVCLSYAWSVLLFLLDYCHLCYVFVIIHAWCKLCYRTVCGVFLLNVWTGEYRPKYKKVGEGWFHHQEANQNPLSFPSTPNEGGEEEGSPLRIWYFSSKVLIYIYECTFREAFMMIIFLGLNNIQYFLCTYP